MSTAPAPRWPAEELRSRVRLRAARPGDVAALEALIAAHTADGALLPRTHANLMRHLGDFRLAFSGAGLVGCGALQAVNDELAEVRSLAVLPAWRGGGIGGRLVRGLLRDAARRNIPRVFCLTRRVHFFARLGFGTAPMDRFPHKVWNDCRLCPRRDCCDETAMERGVGRTSGAVGRV